MAGCIVITAETDEEFRKQILVEAVRVTRRLMEALTRERRAAQGEGFVDLFALSVRIKELTEAAALALDDQVEDFQEAADVVFGEWIFQIEQEDHAEAAHG